MESRNLLLSGGGEGFMKVWNVSNGNAMNQLFHGAEVIAIRVMDGGLVMTGGVDHIMIMWNLIAGVKVG
jgi:hypothetical protein